MNRIFTLAAAGALTVSALSAQAQITLDGVINANEIGTGAGKYTSLGAFTPTHVSNAGFGMAGLLRMYGANTNNKLYVGLAGTLEASRNNFQLWLDVPGRSGVAAGTPLPSIAGTSTVFGTFTAGSIGGTKMDMDVDAAIATTGQGDVFAAVYSSATTAVAKSLGDGLSTTVTSDGVPGSIGGAQTTGVYSLFAGTRLAYLAPAGDISANPGNANGGGAGSMALEYEFDRTAMGLPSGASIVRLMAAYVSGDGFWSSDVIPEVPGNGNNNLGFSPDFTALGGTQAATLNVVVTSARRADEAVVAMSVFPNPTQGRSTVTYQVQGAAQPVTVRVTDLLGRPVRTLLDAPQTAGFHDVAVNTQELAAGAYLVKVQVGDKTATRQLAVTR